MSDKEEDKGKSVFLYDFTRKKERVNKFKTLEEFQALAKNEKDKKLIDWIDYIVKMKRKPYIFFKYNSIKDDWTRIKEVCLKSKKNLHFSLYGYSQFILYAIYCEYFEGEELKDFIIKNVDFFNSQLELTKALLEHINQEIKDEIIFQQFLHYNFKGGHYYNSEIYEDKNENTYTINPPFQLEYFSLLTLTELLKKKQISIDDKKKIVQNLHSEMNQLKNDLNCKKDVYKNLVRELYLMFFKDFQNEKLQFFDFLPQTRSAPYGGRKLRTNAQNDNNIQEMCNIFNLQLSINDIESIQYFNDYKSFIDLTFLLPKISFNKIIFFLYNSKREDVLKIIDKYFETIKTIENNSIIFEYDNEKDKEQIALYYPNIKTEEIKNAEYIKEPKEGEIIYYTCHSSNEISVLFTKFYRINLSKNPLSIIKSFNYDNRKIEINFEEKTATNEKIVQFLAKKHNYNELFNDCKDLIQEYIKLNCSNILKNEKKEEGFDIIDKNNHFNSKFIDEPINQVMTFLNNNQIKVYVDANKENKTNLYKALKEDLLEGRIKCKEETNTNNLLDLVVYWFKRNQDSFSIIYNDYKTNESNPYETNKKQFCNSLIKSVEKALPKIINEMKEKIIDFLQKIFKFSSFEQKLVELFSEIQYLKYFPNNKQKTLELAYLYAFIENNLSNFHHLERIYNYAGINELNKLDSLVSNTFKDSRLSQDLIDQNEVIGKALDCIISNYTFPDNLKNFNYSKFRYICNEAFFLEQNLTLFSKSVNKLEHYFLFFEYLTQKVSDEQLKKFNSIRNNECTIQNFNAEYKFYCSIIENKDKDKKEYFTDFRLFILKIFESKFKGFKNEEITKKMIDIILSNKEYISSSKQFFELIFYEISFIPVNEKLDLEQTYYSKDNSLLCYIEEQLSFKKDNSEYLEEIIINIFENKLYQYIQNQIANNPENNWIVGECCIEYLQKTIDYLNKENNYKNIIKLFSIAFLKVYLWSYFSICDKDDTQTDFSDVNSILNTSSDNVKRVLQLYVLKYVRRSKNSYKEFKNYNFMNKQMLWTSNLTFLEKYKSSFEYPFLSECSSESPNASSFYENYNNIKKIIEYLETKTFRTTEKDEEIKNFIKDNNFYNFDIFIDVIFNLIYSQLDSEYYKNDSINFYEFNNWINNLIKEIEEKEPIKFMKYIFSKIKEIIAFGKENLLKIETILISIKFAYLFTFDQTTNFNYTQLLNTIDKETEFITIYDYLQYIKNKSFLYQTNYQVLLIHNSSSWKILDNNYANKEYEKRGIKGEPLTPEQEKKNNNNNSPTMLNILKKDYYNLQGKQGYKLSIEQSKKMLISKLWIFVIYSFYYYYFFKNKASLDVPEDYQEFLENIYNDIKNELHYIGIKNEKIFMNVLYNKLKHNILEKKDLKGGTLYIKIKTIINDYLGNANKTPGYISYMNEFIGKNEIESRDLVLDQRIPYNTIDSQSYPYIRYFFYSSFPTFEHFKKTFNEIFNKENKYPLINEVVNNKLDISNISQDRMNQLIDTILEKENDDTKFDIQTLFDDTNNHLMNNNYSYSYNYMLYESFEDIIAHFSCRDIYGQNELFLFNGDIIIYDFKGIEKELLSIFSEAYYKKKDNEKK